MFIERIFPEDVAEKSTLYKRLFEEARVHGLSNEAANLIISIVPKILIDAGVFLDKLTNLWRYEFGIPYEIGKDYVLGTHMWVPVHCLFKALLCAHSRLPQVTCADYLKRLTNPDKHQDALVEMIPGYKVDSSVEVQFEVPGQGTGNQTIDWVIGPHDGRTVLLDVKRRKKDFIEQMEKNECESVAL